MNEDIMNININLENIRRQLTIMNKLKAYQLKHVDNCDIEEINQIILEEHKWIIKNQN